MVGARPAGEADAQRCADLCKEALEGLQDKRGGTLLARRESGLLADELMRPDGLSGVLVDSKRRVLVGTVDDEVVGIAIGRVDPVDEASLGVLDALYVQERRRGMGVGQRLVEALVQWFGASGCNGVDAAALPGDRATKNFFEAAGFKARLLVMHRPFD